MLVGTSVLAHELLLSPLVVLIRAWWHE